MTTGIHCQHGDPIVAAAVAAKLDVMRFMEVKRI